MQKESFVFKKSWLLAIEGYASNVRCEFYEAVFAYLSCGRTVDLVSGGAKRAFASVKKDIELYNADVDKQQHISDVRREAGKKSGEARRNKSIEQKETKRTNVQFVQDEQNPPSPSRMHVLEVNQDNIDDYKNKIQKIEKETQKKENEKEIDVRAFIEYFNETLRKANAVIPHSCTVTEKRVTALKARCREHGKESLKTMTEKAAQSDFLNGRNNKCWVASLDWLLRPNNFVKVIEGNYDNDKPKFSDYGNQQPTIDPRRGTPARQHTLEEFLAQD